MTFSSEIKKVITVFFRKSTQSRSSAHLQKAPILKAEKVNEHPASNKCPPHPTPPHPTPLPPPNETLPQRQSLLQGQSIYRNLTLLHLRILLLPFIVLLHGRK